MFSFQRLTAFVHSLAGSLPHFQLLSMGDVIMDSKINAEDNIGDIFVADMNVHVEWDEESESIYLISYTASQTFCMEKSLIFSKIGQTSESRFLSIFKLILNEFKSVI